jgi:hypothetical protein
MYNCPDTLFQFSKLSNWVPAKKYQEAQGRKIELPDKEHPFAASA